jgi:hypothetical protein
MTEDLSQYHHPLSNLFASNDLAQFRLSDEQVEFYRENGYVAGIRLLNDGQIEVLRREVLELVDPSHPGNGLFYEFNSNESANPDEILFHALGAWRILPGLHDILWHRSRRLHA